MQGERREELEKILLEPDDGPCCCKMCPCDKHQCPTRIVRCKFPSQSKSLYQQDFSRPPLGQSGEYYNVNKIIRPRVPYPTEQSTTYQVSCVLA